jgi:hypothetical protein
MQGNSEEIIENSLNAAEEHHANINQDSFYLDTLFDRPAFDELRENLGELSTPGSEIKNLEDYQELQDEHKKLKLQVIKNREATDRMRSELETFQKNK